ncbi:hypothetical protein H4R34_006464 [Dimargaris verticillata]|uniref:Uncharacterized protein n=1 Tax=Dimargaris verticillata TaxID=2761393 RepID=A0A9W8ARS5_9FUNG|nr:hypothetical protein H4R34_006464 [Dimargaris verticillata]
MARIYLLALLAAVQASRYAVKATPVYDQDGGADGNMGNPTSDSHFPYSAMGQGYNKEATLGHPGHVLPIPSDQQFNGAGVFQNPSSLYPTAQEHQSPSEFQFDDNTHLLAQGEQLSEAADQPSQSKNQANNHIDPAKINNYPYLDPEIRAELLDPNLHANGVIESASTSVSDLQFQIRDYYNQQLVAALGPVDENKMPFYNPVFPDIASAIKKKHFIAFLYVDTESKQLMLRHPYSDKMFREVDYGKLQMWLTLPEYFSSVYIIPLSTNHFLLHMALMEQVDQVNFSNDPVRHMFDGKQMPPKNTIFKPLGELGLNG